MIKWTPEELADMQAADMQIECEEVKPKHQMRKDPGIGYRTIEEVNRLAVKEQVPACHWMEKHGFNKQSYGHWQGGQCPSGVLLKLLLLAGADIYYILLGKRSEAHECKT